MPSGQNQPSDYSFRTYLRTLAILVLVMLFGIGAANGWFLFVSETFHYTALYHHRLAKIEGDYDLVFIGDSSLGNAIDEALFTELSGFRTGNLALTGLYGYAGSYNMLRRAFEANPNLKTVVVMQTFDMMTRPVAYNGYLHSFNGRKDLLELPAERQTAVADEFLNMIFSVENFLSGVKSWLKPTRRPIVDDYIEQLKPFDIHLPPESEYIFARRINPDKSWFLKYMETYARNKGIRVIYVHGPIWEPILAGSVNYLKEINRIIADTGVDLTPEIVLIKSGELGDSTDHVASLYKDKYTRQFFEHLYTRLKY